MRTDNDDRLRDGLAALAEHTEAAASEIDLADGIMAAIADEPAKAPVTPWWRRPWLVPMTVAVAAAAILFVAWPRAATELRLSAPDGAEISQNDRSRAVRGDDIAVAAGAVVRTSGGQVASLRAPGFEARMSEDAALSVDSRGQLHVLDGVVDVIAPKQISVLVGDSSVSGQGHFAVEPSTTSGFVPQDAASGGRTRTTETTPMKILTKYRVAAASAVAAVAVFAGWATLSSGATKADVKAPGGVYVDGDGRPHRFSIDRGGDVASAGDKTKSGSDSVSGASASDPTQQVGGAFWDEDKQVISFTVPGEVIDGNSGEPVASFQIHGEATHSADFGQARPRDWSFSDTKEGAFKLEGLGLGTWRLTVTAEGYAPVATVIDLSELDADPYIVVPMFEGATLSGRVVDWRGRPVADAKIGMTECFERKDDKTCGLTTSKADGTFSLPQLPEDRVFSIYAMHPKYGFASENDIRRAPDSTEHVVIQLSGIVRIYGEVTRGKDLTPAAGVIVSDQKNAQATTDQNGVYEMFAPLEARPQAFVETRDGDRVIGRAASYPESRSAWTLQWVEADTHVAEVRIDFRLAMENATLFGTVADKSGKPIPNLELDLANTTGWAKSRQHETFPTYTRTDAQGRYRIENVPAEAGYQIHYRFEGQERWQTLGYVNVKDESEVEANFNLGTGGIRGRFVDKATGEAIAPSAACNRFAARSTSGVYAQANCYGDGRFEFENLAPGVYELENRVDWMTSPIEFVPQKVEVATGSIVENVDVKVEGERSDTWHFRVLNKDGKFISGAYVRIHAGGTSFTSNLRVEADGTAAFPINRKYKQIFIDAPGYESATLDLTGKDPDKVIEARLEKL